MFDKNMRASPIKSGKEIQEINIQGSLVIGYD
jgi:hypothetical protein